MHSLVTEQWSPVTEQCRAPLHRASLKWRQTLGPSSLPTCCTSFCTETAQENRSEAALERFSKSRSMPCYISAPSVTHYPACFCLGLHGRNICITSWTAVQTMKLLPSQNCRFVAKVANFWRSDGLFFPPSPLSVHLNSKHFLC